MGDEKRNRIVAAVTINAVILILIIVAVIIYQVVTLSNLNKRKQDLYEQLYSLEQRYEQAEWTLDQLLNNKEYRDLVEELGKLGITINPPEPQTDN